MCIVSFIQKNHNHFILTHNRDENIFRKYSQELQSKTIYNQQITYPEDEESKGTWFLTSKQYVACLLNGEFVLHKRNIPYERSRGTLLSEAIQYKSITEFAQEYHFKGFECFTIFIIDLKNNEKKILTWNEKRIHIQDISQDFYIVKCSSTLYNDEEKLELESKFKKNMRKCHSKEEILAWHFENRMTKNDRFPNIQTVCISQFELINNQTSMDFYPNIDKINTL